MDYEQQLASVNAAIAAIEGGAQEYRIGSQTVRRGELATLYAERRRLESIINAQNGGTRIARFSRRW